MSVRKLFVALCCLALLSPSSAQQLDVPSFIRYNATLPSSWISPSDPAQLLTITARVYADDRGGWPLWLETFQVVPDAAGRVTLLLGTTGRGGLPPTLFAMNAARWISLQLRDGEETARAALISVPYALKARDADTLGGLPASAFLQTHVGTSTASDNNYRLATTGTATYTSVTPGAANIVPKFIDASNLGGSQITDTGLGVGLGVLTPQEMLDINGRTLLRSTSRGPAGLWFGSNDASSAFVGLRAADNGSSLSIFHGGAPRLNVTPGGRVGIGVDAPAAALDVLGGIKISTTLTFGDGTAMSTAPSGVLNLVAGDASAIVGRSGANTTIAVADLGITTAKLADNAVTTSKIADASITTAKFAPGALSGAGLVTLGVNNFTGAQSVSVNSATTAAISAINSSATGTAYAVYAESASTTGAAVMAYSPAASGQGAAVSARNDGSNGYAVYGSATTGAGIGIYGIARGATGIGVYGKNASVSGTNYGVYGETAAASYSAGVYGLASNSTAATIEYGVYGKAEGAYGVGVLGFAPNVAIGGGAPTAVAGRVTSINGIAGLFVNSAATGNVIVAQNSSGNVWRVNNAGDQYMAGTVHTGGADFAELVETSSSATVFSPGDVLAISLQADRQVELSSEPYSTRVLGVFATKPGILAGRNGIGESISTELPVAMLGIVPVKASAENGAIERGDLLVSAATPGHVMKATDRTRMAGAIVGKAMQPLASGTGVIEIAVTLQ